MPKLPLFLISTLIFASFSLVACIETELEQENKLEQEKSCQSNLTSGLKSGSKSELESESKSEEATLIKKVTLEKEVLKKTTMADCKCPYQKK